MQKPWTKILLVVSVGSLEKRSNQPKYKEPKTRSPKTTAKLIHNNVYCFLITIFRLTIPAFFRLTSANMKKAGMASRNIVIREGYHMLIFFYCWALYCTALAGMGYFQS